jgi:hypothetical protein
MATWAAKITVRLDSDGKAHAGFASTLPRGKDLKTFGRWFGCQMNYRPFKAAMAAAHKFAEDYNSGRVK